MNANANVGDSPAGLRVDSLSDGPITSWLPLTATFKGRRVLETLSSSIISVIFVSYMGIVLY